MALSEQHKMSFQMLVSGYRFHYLHCSRKSVRNGTVTTKKLPHGFLVLAPQECDCQEILFDKSNQVSSTFYEGPERNTEWYLVLENVPEYREEDARNCKMRYVARLSLHLTSFKYFHEKVYVKYEVIIRSLSGVNYVNVENSLETIGEGGSLTLWEQYPHHAHRDSEFRNSKNVSEEVMIIQVKLDIGFSISESLGIPNLSELTDDLYKLVDDQQFGDVTFTVKGGKLVTYKGLLAARSPVFAEMFNSKETVNEIDIPDVEYDVFKELLRFVYTDKTQNMEKVAKQLFVLAERYKMKELKEMCENAMGYLFEVETVVQDLLLAIQYNGNKAKMKALDYISLYKEEVYRTESWKAALRDHPELMADMMSVIEATSAPTTPAVESQNSLKDYANVASLTTCMRSVLESQRFGDVVFVIAGRELLAYKGILAARSPVFAAMFNTDMKEHNESKVEIQDVDFDVFREMLHFVYTNEAPNVSKMTTKLFIAADRFDIVPLKDICEAEICSNFKVQTVALDLIYAVMYNGKRVKDSAIEFIKQNKKNVFRTDGWKAAVKQHSTILANLLPEFL